MRNISLALFISTFLFAFASNTAHSATKPAVIKNKKTKAAAQATPSPSPTPTLTAAGVSTPTPAPPTFMSRVKLSYYGEVQGPRLSNINLLKTQGPEDGDASYSEWDHQVKAGYAVTKNVVLGTIFSAVSYFDPAKNITFKDTKLFGSWNHMVETNDLDMQGVLKLGLPTTSKSRNGGRIVSMTLQNNWTLKTAYRNWSFTAATVINPIYNYNPSGNTDMVVGLFPYVTVDLTPNTQFLFEASFDAAHTYNDSTFDFSQGDPDYVDLGPIFNIGSHVSITTALRFFTESISFKTSCLYFNISAAL